MRGKCETKYKYKVIYTDETDESKNYYFCMVGDIINTFEISKSTIYKIINNKDTKYSKKYKIEKIDKPKYFYTEIPYN